jgi:hypothetical protein
MPACGTSSDGKALALEGTKGYTLGDLIGSPADDYRLAEPDTAQRPN